MLLLHLGRCDRRTAGRSSVSLDLSVDLLMVMEEKVFSHMVVLLNGESILIACWCSAGCVDGNRSFVELDEILVTMCCSGTHEEGFWKRLNDGQAVVEFLSEYFYEVMVLF